MNNLILPCCLNTNYKYLSVRGYTNEQLLILRHALPSQYILAFDLATKVGLRVLEMCKIQDDSKGYYYLGHENNRINLKLSGNLINLLEMTRKEHVIIVTDRHGIFESHFDIKAGHSFSKIFNDISRQLFGWSLGTASLRSSFANNEFERLTQRMSAQRALTIIKKRLGNLGH